MTRNKYEGLCYQCGFIVAAGSGHFERHGNGWRTKHANVSGHGRITCEEAKLRYVRRSTQVAWVRALR